MAVCLVCGGLVLVAAGSFITLAPEAPAQIQDAAPRMLRLALDAGGVAHDLDEDTSGVAAAGLFEGRNLLPAKMSTGVEGRTPVDLVITWHCEDISWLKGLDPALQDLLTIHIYIKRGPKDDSRPECLTKTLPQGLGFDVLVSREQNRGRDCHTQFEFLARNYGNLANFTLFMQGSLHWVLLFTKAEHKLWSWRDPAKALNHFVPKVLREKPRFFPLGAYSDEEGYLMWEDRPHNFSYAEQDADDNPPGQNFIRFKFNHVYADIYNQVREVFSMTFGGRPCDTPRLPFTSGMQLSASRDAILARPREVWQRLADLAKDCVDQSFSFERLTTVLFNTSLPTKPPAQIGRADFCVGVHHIDNGEHFIGRKYFKEPIDEEFQAQFWHRRWGCDPRDRILRDRKARNITRASR